MKNLLATGLLAALLWSCNSSAPSSEVHLFNGEDLSGWHADVPEMDTVPDARNPFAFPGSP